MKKRVDREHLYATLRYGFKHDMDAYTEDTEKVEYRQLNHRDVELIAKLVEHEWEKGKTMR